MSTEGAPKKGKTMFCSEMLQVRPIPVWMMQESVAGGGYIEWCQYCECWSVPMEENEYLPSCWCA